MDCQYFKSLKEVLSRHNATCTFVLTDGSEIACRHFITSMKEQFVCLKQKSHEKYIFVDFDRVSHVVLDGKSTKINFQDVQETIKGS